MPAMSSMCQHGGIWLGKLDVSKQIDTKAKKKPNVGIITHATFERAGETPLDNLIGLAQPLTNRLFVITGDYYRNSTPGVEILRVKAKRRASFIGRVVQQGVTHVRQLRLLTKLRKEIDILIFYFGTPFPVPLIFAQALGMKCFIILATEGSGVWAHAAKASGTKLQFGEFTRFSIQEACERISYYFSDKLIAYSSCAVEQMNLRRYIEKIAIYPKYVSDYDIFDAKTKIEDRHGRIGYVGRLNEEKGILNLLEAIPQVLSERPDLIFTVIGEGRLRDDIQELLERNNLAEHVELVAWVAHNELPRWLNEFKLVVIPSYTEQGPNIMFECMACGTPVLATRVGAVSNVIEDGKTGFLLENNTPRCIAANITRAISWPNLEQVGRAAYAYVRQECTSKKASEAWSEILNYEPRR
jgi:glycosyltransferase involved in cell wall biosynthesis